MRVQAPSNSDSNYFNYKQFFSMVMMAACDAQYKFTWVDVGQFGSISDGGVWANTDFVEDLSSGDVPLPDPSPLPGSEMPFPYVFVGDEAFPLTTYMMRPYPRKTLTDEKRIFNYRLSRARRVIENAFGILTARWKILQRPLCMSPTNCENIFRALPCLHNFIMMAEEERNWNDREYCPRNIIDVETEDGTITDGEWRNYCISYFARLGRVGANRAGDIANGMRNYLRDYFVSSMPSLRDTSITQLIITHT
ncbi:PREDICTED: uncharacterized protein LOC105555895 [Vollenhovia emeryi]|uniref:uncharacterized protein LOC105555895 n=1 Tax=Vollenhovia emeryi TaxID=411798 RepID=UPI0005F51E01|nr:PREDICTED: uncharacterized protein LOC105555895 [Vollenhovia emeryi]XP_011858329.1 PREDICTED: uncharacterized protein LOC105555895 [Vollenhovia emeryi]